MKLSKSFARLISAVVLLLILAFSVGPFAALIIGAIMPNQNLDRGVRFDWPLNLTLGNYSEFFREIDRYSLYLVNTLVVSLTTVGIVIIISVLAAYGITRYQFRGRTIIKQAALLGYLFPPVVLVFPYLAGLQAVSLNGTLTGLILANVAFCFPFALWLTVQYLDAVPLALDMSAAVDGASWFQTLQHVVARRALPGILAVAAFCFILSWNDVVLALVLAKPDTMTLAAGVNEDILSNASDLNRYGTFSAGSVIIAGLAVALFGGLQLYTDRRLRIEAEEQD